MPIGTESRELSGRRRRVRSNRALRWRQRVGNVEAIVHFTATATDSPFFGQQPRVVRGASGHRGPRGIWSAERRREDRRDHRCLQDLRRPGPLVADGLDPPSDADHLDQLQNLEAVFLIDADLPNFGGDARLRPFRRLTAVTDARAPRCLDRRGRRRCQPLHQRHDGRPKGATPSTST